MQHRARLGYLPGLDGLRGLSVVVVFLYHAGHATGGFLGVSTFFTLSGFLITSLLVLEHDSTGRIDLVAFWGRRARRLIPAAYVTILGILLWLAYESTGYPVDTVRGDVAAALLYVSNWRFIIQELDYSAAFVPSLFTHFWSLAIEEQFYLVFPLVFVGVRRVTRGRQSGLVAALTGLVLLSYVVTLVIDDGDAGGVVYLSTFTRAGEILVGALLGVVVLGRRPEGVVRRVADVVGLAALVGIVACVVWIRLDDAVLRQGGLLAFSVLSVAVVAGVVVGRGLTASLLSFAPLRWLGLISYGVYLAHYPLIRILTPLRTGIDPGWTLTALHAVLTLLVAVVSYRILEQPIRRRRLLPSASAGVLVPLAGVALFAFAIVVVPTDGDGRSEVVADLTDGGPGGPGDITPGTAPPSTTTVPGAEPVRTLPIRSCVLFDYGPGDVFPGMGVVADPGTDLPKVMVVGDSVGCTAGQGIQRWGEGDGSLTVLNQSTLGCGIFREAYIRTTIQEGPLKEPCDWTLRWPEQVEAFDPDLVVVLAGAWDVSDRRLPGSEEFVAPGDASYDETLTAEARRAHELLTAGGADVIWLTSPRIELGQVDGAPPLLGDPASDPERMALYNRVIADAVGDEPDVHIVDLSAWLDGLDGGATSASRRPDGVHFSDEGADEAAAWLGPQLEAFAAARLDVPPPDPGPSTNTTTTTTTTTVPPVELDVMLAGDSLSVGIWPPMEAALDVRLCTVPETVCAGLAFPEVQEEWARIFADEPPDVVVVLMATWENLGLRSENSPIDPKPGEPGWQDEYRRVVLDPWVAAAEAVGTEIVWVGMPRIRHAPSTAMHAELNEVWRRLGEDHDVVTFIDGAAILAGPDGGYAEIDTTVEPAERLFMLDGLHLCPAGAERLVTAVTEVVGDRFGRVANEGWASDPTWRVDERGYEAGGCPEPAVG